MKNQSNNNTDVLLDIRFATYTQIDQFRSSAFPKDTLAQQTKFTDIFVQFRVR